MEPNESGGRPWKRLTAERKFELYLATRAPEAPVGEILRKAGLTLEDLREIEEMVAASAITGLKARSRSARYNKRTATPEEYHQLSLELQQKEKALADLTVEHMMLKKKSAWACRSRTTARSRRRAGGHRRSSHGSARSGVELG